jgi:hypothetical protein
MTDHNQEEQRTIESSPDDKTQEAERAAEPQLETFGRNYVEKLRRKNKELKDQNKSYAEDAKRLQQLEDQKLQADGDLKGLLEKQQARVAELEQIIQQAGRKRLKDKARVALAAAGITDEKQIKALVPGIVAEATDKKEIKKLAKERAKIFAPAQKENGSSVRYAVQLPPDAKPQQAENYTPTQQRIMRARELDRKAKEGKYS